MLDESGDADGQSLTGIWGGGAKEVEKEGARSLDDGDARLGSRDNQ